MIKYNLRTSWKVFTHLFTHFVSFHYFLKFQSFFYHCFIFIGELQSAFISRSVSGEFLNFPWPGHILISPLILKDVLTEYRNHSVKLFSLGTCNMFLCTFLASVIFNERSIFLHFILLLVTHECFPLAAFKSLIVSLFVCSNIYLLLIEWCLLYNNGLISAIHQHEFNHMCKSLGFPGSSVGKESACSAGGPGLIPGSGRSPGEGNGKPLQYPCHFFSFQKFNSGVLVWTFWYLFYLWFT